MFATFGSLTFIFKEFDHMCEMLTSTSNKIYKKNF